MHILKTCFPTLHFVDIFITCFPPRYNLWIFPELVFPTLHFVDILRTCFPHVTLYGYSQELLLKVLFKLLMCFFFSRKYAKTFLVFNFVKLLFTAIGYFFKRQRLRTLALLQLLFSDIFVLYSGTHVVMIFNLFDEVISDFITAQITSVSYRLSKNTILHVTS